MPFSHIWGQEGGFPGMPGMPGKACLSLLGPPTIHGYHGPLP